MLRVLETSEWVEYPLLHVVCALMICVAMSMNIFSILVLYSTGLG